MTVNLKTNCADQTADPVGVVSGFKQFCAASCDKIVARIRQAKETILTEARTRTNASERMLQLSLNEAEAVAWQTNFPHLIFPTLAMERVQSVTAWQRRQQWLRRQPRTLSN